MDQAIFEHVPTLDSLTGHLKCVHGVNRQRCFQICGGSGDSMARTLELLKFSNNSCGVEEDKEFSILPLQGW